MCGWRLAAFADTFCRNVISQLDRHSTAASKRCGKSVLLHREELNVALLAAKVAEKFASTLDNSQSSF